MMQIICSMPRNRTLTYVNRQAGGFPRQHADRLGARFLKYAKLMQGMICTLRVIRLAYEIRVPNAAPLVGVKALGVMRRPRRAGNGTLEGRLRAAVDLGCAAPSAVRSVAGVARGSTRRPGLVEKVCKDEGRRRCRVRVEQRRPSPRRRIGRHVGTAVELG
jgi:hypothetical protein